MDEALPIDKVKRGMLSAAKQKKYVIISIYKTAESPLKFLKAEKAEISYFIYSHFIVLELPYTNDDARNFCNIHLIRDFPYIACINPLTGSEVSSYTYTNNIKPRKFRKWAKGVFLNIQDTHDKSPLPPPIPIESSTKDKAQQNIPDSEDQHQFPKIIPGFNNFSSVPPKESTQITDLSSNKPYNSSLLFPSFEYNKSHQDFATLESDSLVFEESPLNSPKETHHTNNDFEFVQPKLSPPKLSDSPMLNQTRISPHESPVIAETSKMIQQQSSPVVFNSPEAIKPPEVIKAHHTAIKSPVNVIGKHTHNIEILISYKNNVFVTNTQNNVPLLDSLMKFANKHHSYLSNFNFLFNGKEITELMTPKQIGLKNKDTIYALYKRTFIDLIFTGPDNSYTPIHFLDTFKMSIVCDQIRKKYPNQMLVFLYKNAILDESLSPSELKLPPQSEIEFFTRDPITPRSSKSQNRKEITDLLPKPEIPEQNTCNVY